MILGWSGTVTPWNHFSNIDFRPPEIILAVTNPPPKSFQQQFWYLKIIFEKWFCMSCTTSQKIVQGPQNHFKKNAKWFQGVGSPKLLLVQTPQNHITQIAEMIFFFFFFWGGGGGGGKCMKIMLEENLGTCPILNNSGGWYNYMNNDIYIYMPMNIKWFLWCSGSKPPYKIN